MSAENILDVVKCSKSEDEHVIQDAIELSCGHFACKKCSSATNVTHQNSCLKCNNLIGNHPNNSGQKSTLNLIESNLNNLFQVINNKIEEENDKYKGKN